MKFKTIIEPFKIKVVEPIKFTTEKEREEILKRAGYNVFNIPAEDVIIDLLTDSGTNAMSSKQWAGIMDGDESYAGSKSFFRFESVIKKIMGFKHIIPVHQGRAAEKILFSIVAGPGKYIPNNTHFDTTRANIEFVGGTAVDLPIPEGIQPDVWHPFKGNMDVERLESFIREKGPENIPLVMLTVTNNSNGGQPVSMQNIREVREVCNKYGIPLFLDACRFAENAYFIKKREKGYENKSILEIVREMFSYADGCTMSAKKDAFANIGGFLAMNDDELALKARNVLIVTEGFPTYGGLAGRDLEAIAQGLEEVLDENYLIYRIRSVEYLAEKLIDRGIPVLIPPGGHAVYLDAKRFAPHIPPEQFPGQSVVVELYRVGGIRSVEIGSVMFGRKDKETGKFIPHTMELVRLAIPRRVYTQSHIDYVIEVITEVYRNRDKLKGYKIVWEAPLLRHFTAKFEPIN
ncbi:tryptophanase [Candidatus Kryptonium thompsonii]|uniref:Tryptophanase n=1 Tax=Candidatus Kryptonium thompsonii TaxID=1633631 RepID=A0ABM9UWF0_9BACT|nr:tryptophanase [Candidatus Kryptonium thompsoni]CUS78087.1 tryptophanase [Candidatus Kryptonium thompsoni]CUS79979.1 tryptophanase [Candidatus Kryptonium thompsoni]CUS83197.1 tryptophanase [Candidatus Kryptonium thompsoni]CUS83948.1 tryptophanase [Candidatus Kryptonium thompsoni]CUS84890.1 tryptophanase [Candidatus Kryptonium thompsoni]